MKNVIAKAAVLIMAGFAVLSAAAPSETPMLANIPFAFLAGDQMHPAGEYLIRVNADYRYVELRPAKSAIAERVGLNGKSTERNRVSLGKGFLRFERYGSTYALSGVATAQAKAGMSVTPSKAEKELAKVPGGGVAVDVSLAQ